MHQLHDLVKVRDHKVGPERGHDGRKCRVIQLRQAGRANQLLELLEAVLLVLVVTMTLHEHDTLADPGERGCKQAQVLEAIDHLIMTGDQQSVDSVRSKLPPGHKDLCKAVPKEGSVPGIREPCRDAAQKGARIGCDQRISDPSDRVHQARQAGGDPGPALVLPIGREEDGVRSQDGRLDVEAGNDLPNAGDLVDPVAARLDGQLVRATAPPFLDPVVDQGSEVVQDLARDQAEQAGIEGRDGDIGQHFG